MIYKLCCDNGVRGPIVRNTQDEVKLVTSADLIATDDHPDVEPVHDVAHDEKIVLVKV